MQKEHGDCVVTSAQRIGRRSFSKPTLKSKDGRIFFVLMKPHLSQRKECRLRIFQTRLKLSCEVGCERFATKNVHKSKDKNTYKDVKTKRYKKLWNLHWALRTAWQKKHEEKQRQRTADESAREMSVDGQDLTICGGCQGYMDFFSEVFCVVIFFSSTLHFCTLRNTKMENIIKDWKKEQTLSVTFPNTIQSKRSFLSVLFFLQASFLNFVVREGNSPSLVS